MYLDIQIIVDLHCVSKQEYVLHETGKLPHAPQLGQGLNILRRLHLRLEQDVELGLLTSALVARHAEGGGALTARRVRNAWCADRDSRVWPVSKGLHVSGLVAKCEVEDAAEGVACEVTKMHKVLSAMLAYIELTRVCASSGPRPLR